MAYAISQRNHLIDAIPATMIEYPDTSRIAHDQVKVYYFDFATKTKVDVKPIPISEYGFDVKSIDNAINKQNHITNNFYDYLKYGE